MFFMTVSGGLKGRGSLEATCSLSDFGFRGAASTDTAVVSLFRAYVNFGPNVKPNFKYKIPF